MLHRPNAKYVKRNRISRYLLLPVFMLFMAGCVQQPVTVPSSSTQDTYSPTEAISHCFEFYDALAKNTQSVNYPAVSRLTGYPFLRSNRFLASFSDRLSTHQHGLWQSWLVQLNQQAIKALMLEWQQLPDSVQRQLTDTQASITRRELQQELQGCGVLLVRALLQQPETWPELLELAQVSDHYSLIKRTLGLYPLVKPFFNAGVETEITHLTEQRRRFIDSPLAGSRLPGLAFDGRPLKETLESPQPIVVDQLGIPLLANDQAQVWLANWRPVWRVEQSGDYDRPGQVYLQAQKRPAIDIAKPVQYEFVSLGRWQGQVTLQLNYSIWFSERPPSGRFDLLAGPLDALIWRVHLDLQGRPLAFDSIHGCGCWYQLYPAKGFTAKAVQDGSESVLVDHALASVDKPLVQDKRVIQLQVRSEDHQLMHAAIVGGGVRQASADIWQRMDVAHMDELYTLPLRDEQGNVSFHSLFDKQGLVPVSQRGERWLFWPMGIASPGAMRSPGTHAIAFVGRRHFDDADILQRVGLVKESEQFADD